MVRFVLTEAMPLVRTMLRHLAPIAVSLAAATAAPLASAATVAPTPAPFAAGPRSAAVLLPAALGETGASTHAILRALELTDPFKPAPLGAAGLRLGDSTLRLDVPPALRRAFEPPAEAPADADEVQLDGRYAELPRPRWHGGDTELREVPAASLEGPDEALPCGLFLDGEPKLSLLEDPPWGELPFPTIVPNSHTEKSGKVVDYDNIPRRWDRPVDYEAYRYPIPAFNGWRSVASGYDLDLPDDRQRRGKMNAVGHGGLDLPQEIGAPIHVLALTHQVGHAEVLFVGKMWGNTVITRHTLREAKRLRNYVLIWAHLDEAATGIYRGTLLRDGALLGFVGNTDTPDFTHLHLEARRLADWVDPRKVQPGEIFAREVSTVTDPRNVLPLKRQTQRGPSCTQRLTAARLSPMFAGLRLAL